MGFNEDLDLAMKQALRQTIEANRPLPRGERVRVPGDGSQRRRAAARQRGTIPLDDKVYARIQELIG